ncbi:20805_t:CDS:2, partial [Dentiscutata erythropus]
YNIIWQWLTLFGWIDTSILYCTIVVILVIRKLRSVKKEFDDVFNSATSQLSDYPTLINKKLISSVVRRVLWYPVVPLVAQFFNSFVETYAYVYHSISFPLLSLCYVGMSLQGLLNALVFSQDIAVTHAYHAVKLQLWISNVNSFEYHYPHLSHNKEWLSYMLLIKLFSAPKNSSSQFIPPEVSSPINTFAGNKPNVFSVLEKDDLKDLKDISLDYQNDDQDIHLAFPEPVHLKDSSQLNLLSNYLDSSISSDPLIGCSRSNQINQTNISNINNICNPLNSTTNVIENNEGRIDVNGESTKRVSKESTKRVSKESTKRFGSDIDISQDIEIFKLMLQRL